MLKTKDISRNVITNFKAVIHTYTYFGTIYRQLCEIIPYSARLINSLMFYTSEMFKISDLHHCDFHGLICMLPKYISLDFSKSLKHISLKKNNFHIKFYRLSQIAPNFWFKLRDECLALHNPQRWPGTWTADVTPWYATLQKIASVSP